MLSAMKLAEYRYGKEEMLGLYPVALVQDTPSSNSSTLLDADILEAMETTSLLVPDRRALPPLNLMGAASEDEQRAWSRGANSDTSLRLYSKQKDMSRVIEDGMAGRGRMDAGPSLRGDHRGGLPERGRGRGVGRGGSINTGGPFFDRHRSDDPMLDDALAGSRASNGGRGIGSSDIGSNDGGRPFGGGRGSRAFDRSLSSGGNWYADRSGSNGPSTAGIIGPGTTDESVNNGSLSPRKGYTRAPFDDWRKLPTERKMETEADGEILVQDPQVGDGTRLLRVAQIVVLVHHKVGALLTMDIEVVQNTKKISLMEAAAGGKMVRMIPIFPGHVVEHFLLVIEEPFPTIRLVVNVQGKTRIFQSGPWMMTLPEVHWGQLEEHLIHQENFVLHHLNLHLYNSPETTHLQQHPLAQLGNHLN